MIPRTEIPSTFQGGRGATKGCRQSTPRAGFTLVEVICASALTVILMAAVYEGMDIYRRYTTVGRVEVERQQVSRAVLRMIDQDMRAATFRDPNLEATDGAAAGSTTSSGAAGGSSQAAEETETVVKVQSAEEAWSGKSIGVFGDATMVVIHIARPLRGMNYSAGVDGEAIKERSSDLRSVAYFLAVPGASGLAGVVGQKAAQETGDTSVRSVQGLARLEGDRLAMQSADGTSDISSLVGHSQIIAAEVNLLQFEYHDGTAWVASWDSVGMGRLPQAVRVTLGFRPPPEPKSANSSPNLMAIPDTSSVGIVRKVIPLITADPTAGQAEVLP